VDCQLGNLGSVTPKITKIEIYVTLVLHVVLYGCETMYVDSLVCKGETFLDFGIKSMDLLSLLTHHYCIHRSPQVVPIMPVYQLIWQNTPSSPTQR